MIAGKEPFKKDVGVVSGKPLLQPVKISLSMFRILKKSVIFVLIICYFNEIKKIQKSLKLIQYFLKNFYKNYDFF